MVGVRIHRTNTGFKLTQPNLINKILKESWDGVSKNTTPLPKGFNSNFVPDEVGVEVSAYLYLIGSLNYVLVGTRPDITYGVNCLARFSSRPLHVHWKALKHLVGYLAATKERVLLLQPRMDIESPVD